MAGLLAIMGSGETAPTMVKTHRWIFERVGERPAVLLDTPYGFQSNADDISARALGYFAASVGRTVNLVSWRAEPPPGLARERALTALRSAGWVFAGPGSPTYALRHWRGSAVSTVLTDLLRGDGVVVLASAAALTLGSHTVPVYEIYKAGVDPHWQPGLNLLDEVCGLPAVVIPHYDNAEGGHHDTRFCYLGEDRLARMEQELPESSFVLGVDEHTGVLLDLNTGTATVVGNGTMTIRRGRQSLVHPSGSVLTFEQILTPPNGAGSRVQPGTGKTANDSGSTGTIAAGTVVDSTLTTGVGPGGDAAIGAAAERDPGLATDHAVLAPAQRTGATTSLRGSAEQLASQFDQAMRDRHVDGCVEAILTLEQTILDWSADTLTSDEGDYARGQLRMMVVRLGDLAEVGARDPKQFLGPVVDALVELRQRARQARDWATSDWIRDQLSGAGVELRDTPAGSLWHLSQTTPT